MKDCTCKEKETTTQCTPNPCDFVYKMPVDGCTNKTVYYITLASAVLMSCNDEETVEHVLNLIRSDLTDLNYITNDSAWQTLINKITAYLKTHLTELDPQLREYVNNLITEYFDNIDFDSLNTLFTNLFTDWKAHLDSLLESIAGSIQFDNTPTLGSNNAVTSDGIAKALANKQDKADAIKDVIFEVNGSSLINGQDHKAHIPPYGLATALFKGKNTEADNNVNFYVKAYDVNDDGIWDIADVNAVINVMLGNEPSSKYDGRSDVNGSGTTDISDVNQVINMMLGKIEDGPYIAYRNSDYTNPITLPLNHIYLNKNINDLFLVVRTDGNRFFIKYLHINSDNDFKAAAENSLIVNVNSVNSYTCTHINIGSYDQFIKLINEETPINFVYINQVSQSNNLHVDDKGTISCEVTITVRDEETGNTEDVKYYYIWEKGKKSIMTTAPIIVNEKYISLDPKITEELTTNIFSIKNNLDNSNIIRSISIRQDGELITPNNNNGDITVDTGVPIELTVGYNDNCIIINNETSERCIPY